ncbi:MAG: helix-turn-helix transcriptional regulator, partial [Clostridia bacterium]|nr:helix-turn-helix transcriptional regulator [Clostridia bacterium]
KKEFLEKGIEGSSMRDIAAGSSMTVGNLYRYFKNKEEIADFVCNDVLRNCEIKYFNIVLKLYSKNLAVGVGVAIYVYFASIIENENLLRFYSEVLKSNTASLIGNASYRSILAMLASKAGLDKDAFDIYYIATTSVPGTLLYAYKTGVLKDKEEVLNFILQTAIAPLFKTKADRIISDVVSDVKGFRIDLATEFLSEYKVANEESGEDGK